MVVFRVAACSLALLFVLSPVACSQKPLHPPTPLPAYFVAWPRLTEAAVFKGGQPMGVLSGPWLFRSQDVLSEWLSLDLIVRNNPFGLGAFVKVDEVTLWPPDPEQLFDGRVRLDRLQVLLKDHGYLEGVELRVVKPRSLELRVTEDLDGTKVVRYDASILNPYSRQR